MTPYSSCSVHSFHLCSTLSESYSSNLSYGSGICFYLYSYSLPSWPLPLLRPCLHLQPPLLPPGLQSCPLSVPGGSSVHELTPSLSCSKHFCGSHCPPVIGQITLLASQAIPTLHLTFWPEALITVQWLSQPCTFLLLSKLVLIC